MSRSDSKSTNKTGVISSLRRLSQSRVRAPEREARCGLSVALQPLAQLLCCPGCHTLLLHPISLPCGHSLCQACLAAQRKRNKLRESGSDAGADAISVNSATEPALEEPLAACSRCQASYPLVPAAAWSFPANVLLARTVQRLLDAHPELRRHLQHCPPHLRALRALRAPASCPLPVPVCVGPRPVPCELCSKRRPAHSYCATCRLHYCARCLRKLHGNPAYGAHTLTEPAQEEGRELCPAHPECSLTHFCPSDGTLGCHACMTQANGTHHGHPVVLLAEARLGAEALLGHALEHANTVQQHCDSDWEQMEALSACVSSGSAELRRSIRQGFLSLRNALLDQEVALLSHLDTLSSSTAAVAQAFLQRAGPLRSSLAGMREIGEQALLEPRASVFLQGAAELTRWLGALSAQMPRPETHLLPAGHQPFAGADLHFDHLLHDLQSLMGKHLSWKPASVVARPTAVATETVGEEESRGMKEDEEEEDQEKEEEEEEEAEVEEEVCRRAVVGADAVPEPGTPSLGSVGDEEFLEMEEELEMPAGDGAREAKASLLPRPPIIYQHNIYGTTVEVFWMVPMGEDVHSFDVHFQDAAVGVSCGRGVMMAGVKGHSLQTSGLHHDTQYLFRARSVNKHGHGSWSSVYRVNTGRSEVKEKEQNATLTQEE